MKTETRELIGELLAELNRNAASGFLTVKALTLATQVEKAVSKEPGEPARQPAPARDFPVPVGLLAEGRTSDVTQDEIFDCYQGGVVGPEEGR